MKLIFKLKTEEWLFARNFAYVDNKHEPYIYQQNLFKKPKSHEPKKDDTIPYIMLDDSGLLINEKNQKGNWLEWEWENTKSIRLYELMHPWKASIFSWMHHADFYRERRKTKKYLRIMRWRYKKFHYTYEEQYNKYYSIILEGKKENGQIYIPSEWIEEERCSFAIRKIQEKSKKRIKYMSTDDDLQEVFQHFKK